MSVSIQEVIEAGGYDLNTYEDAQWLLSNNIEWEQLIDNAQALVDAKDDEEYQKPEQEYQERFGE
jgi:hypothetical protein